MMHTVNALKLKSKDQTIQHLIYQKIKAFYYKFYYILHYEDITLKRY